MKCPKCGFEQSDKSDRCLRCGIIFSEFHNSQRIGGESDISPDKEIEPEPESTGKVLSHLFFDVKFETNPLIFAGRVLFFVIIVVWGVVLINASIESNYVARSFWHLLNLPFHEAGHIVFRPFGRIIHSLGGSLGQLLMPLICFAVFLIKTRDQFAASFCIWWLGENFLDMAPYINDARSLSLPLLGGNVGYSSPYGFHDWEFILTELGLARYDHFLAGCSWAIGTVLMIISFLWGGYLLVKQFKYLI